MSHVNELFTNLHATKERVRHNGGNFKPHVTLTQWDEADMHKLAKALNVGVNDLASLLLSAAIKDTVDMGLTMGLRVGTED